MNRSPTPSDVAVLAGGSFFAGMGMSHPAVFFDPVAYAPLVAFWTFGMWVMTHALRDVPEMLDDASDRLASRLDGGDAR